MKPQFFPIILILIVSSYGLRSQPWDTLAVDKKRLQRLTIVSGAGYGLSLVGMQALWYRNSEKQSFRFFNDNAEWKQIDKLGHFYSAFYFSYGASAALRWCNLPVKKSDAIGALTGLLIMVPVEVFDGFSAAYGASAGDLIANTAGSAFFLGQKSLWGEVRLIPKLSFHRSAFADERPDILGANLISEVFKDYNGHTLWLAADMDKFVRFPKWLNLAVGYGADGMVYARDHQNAAFGYSSHRQYYVSLDFDLTAIQTRSRFLRTILFVASAIKIPAPTLEFSRKKVHWHPLYF